jgi:hypothetical protein
MRAPSILLFCGLASSQYNDWTMAYREADRILAGMTTSEKLSIGQPSFFGGPKQAGLPKGIIAKDGERKENSLITLDGLRCLNRPRRH